MIPLISEILLNSFSDIDQRHVTQRAISIKAAIGTENSMKPVCQPHNKRAAPTSKPGAGLRR